jgi:hypothetical protein
MASLTAVLVVIAIVLIVIVVWATCKGRGLNRGAQAEPFQNDLGSLSLTDGMSAGVRDESAGPERRSVQAALSRLYSTADVDPLLTGQLYAHADNVRNVYAERTSHGDVYGLAEYNSSGGPGDVGVDVGPFGLAEYGGKVTGFDDGIPEAWAFPSTPIRWYRPKQRDFYGPEGPTVYSEGLYPLTEPDHDVLMN